MRFLRFPNAQQKGSRLRLVVWGLGVDAKSVRSVRKCSQAFAVCPQAYAPKIVAQRRTVVSFGLALGLRVSKVSTVTGIGGSWSRNADLSSLLDLRWVFASQKCQQSQGHRDRGGRGRETQTCRHFWTGVGSSRLKSVDSHRGPGGPGRETQSCRHFCFHVARVSTVTEIGRVLVAKRRTVVTFFGLAFGVRVSKVSTVTGIGGSWSRNADLLSLLDLRLKSVNSHRVTGIEGVLVAKCRPAVTFGLGRETQKRGERRERRQERGERRTEEERTERRAERRLEEERRERREERGEERGEKGEERRGERGERREEKRRREEERREKREERGEERRGERKEERGEERRERKEERKEERVERRGERREERGEKREERRERRGEK